MIYQRGDRRVRRVLRRFQQLLGFSGASAFSVCSAVKFKDIAISLEKSTVPYNLTDEQRKKIVVKERMNPSIRVRTYEDFLICSKSTIQFVKNHKGKLEVDTTADNSG